MKRILIALLAATMLLLCACSKSPEAPQTEPTPTEAPTQAPTEAKPKKTYYNPLTGEKIKKTTKSRPFCVAFNNSKAAMPQHGVSQADILYEMLIEGETRCMGVFFNMSAAKQALGSIRSARRDFIRVAMAYDAIFLHNGQSPKQGSSYDQYSAEVFFEESGWDHVDGNRGYADHYFYRTRKENYALEHTLFINPKKAIECAEYLGCTMKRDKVLDVGLKFDKEAFFVGESAKKVQIWFNMSSYTSEQWHKYTTMTYNEETGLYEAYQKHSGYSEGADYIDGNTGEVLTFRNVLVLRTPNETLGNKNGWMKIDVVGEGEGVFACNGQMVPIKWSRPTESDPYTYTLENGTPITLGVGKTYIAIIPMTGQIDAE